MYKFVRSYIESLGSGIPRILRAYGEDSFKFTDNFIRITFPISGRDHASAQVKKLLSVLSGEKGRSELQELLSIKNRDYFRTDYLVPAVNNGYIELTIPDRLIVKIKNIVLRQKVWH